MIYAIKDNKLLTKLQFCDIKFHHTSYIHKLRTGPNDLTLEYQILENITW